MKRNQSGQARAILAWCVSGLLLCHLALLAAVECFHPGIRDPEWEELVGRLRLRRAEAPGRELVVVLGSSRCMSAIDAAWLSRHSQGPLVFNASVPGGGPLMQRILLERLLAEGLRPDHVVLEVMPAFFADRGAMLEESFLSARRLNCGEVVKVVRQAERPRRLLRPYAMARLQPLVELRPLLQRWLLPSSLILADETPPAEGRDAFGFFPLAPDHDSERLAQRTECILTQYQRALNPTRPNEGRAMALHRMLDRCQEEGCGVTVFVGPEHSRFRSLTSTQLAAWTEELLDGVRRRGVTVFDGRDWLGDEAFIDGHHATAAGARAVSQRLEAAALGLGRLSRH